MDLAITYDQPCAFPECAEPTIFRVSRLSEEGGLPDAYLCSKHREYVP